MNALIRESVRAPERRHAWDAFNDIDGLFSNLFNTNLRRVESTGDALTPSIDVTESDASYVVKAEMPGVKKDDIDITLKDGVLTINAETRHEHDTEKDGRVIRQERRYGKFVRSMRLGADVAEDKVSADYNDGVLSLTLPKAEEVQPKKIEVSVS